MKKLSLVLSLAVVVLPTLAFAQLGTTPTSPVQDINGVFALVCKIFNLLFLVLLFAAIFFALFAAFKYLTSGGDPGKVGDASKMLLYAAVAVVVAIIAKYVPNIASSFIGTGVQQVCP